MLLPGEYHLEVKDTDCEPKREVIKISSGEKQELYITLKKVIKNLTVYVYPPKCKIALERRQRYHDIWYGERTLNDLEPGEYYISTWSIDSSGRIDTFYLRQGSENFIVTQLLPLKEQVNKKIREYEDQYQDLIKNLTEAYQDNQPNQALNYCVQLLSINPFSINVKNILPDLLLNNKLDYTNQSKELETLFLMVDDISSLPETLIVAKLFSQNLFRALDIFVGKVRDASSLWQLTKYFYTKNELRYLDNILSRVKYYDRPQLAISSGDIYSLNSTINPESYERIVLTFNKFLVGTPYWFQSIMFYMSNNFELAQKSIEQSLNHDKYDTLTYKYLLLLDPDKDSVSFKHIFPILLNHISSNFFETIGNWADLYSFSKRLFKAGNINMAENCLIKLSKMRHLGDVDSKEQLAWGIGALAAQDKDRAEWIFKNIYFYGTEADQDYMYSELNWWKSNQFHSVFLKSFLDKK